MLAPYAFGGHVLKDGTHTENVHSHPSIGDYAPSGFAVLFPNGQPSYGINPFHGKGGDKGNPQTNGLTRYLYSPSLVKSVGRGYVQYDDKNAIYKGKTKK
ncbi:hypothetical protein RM51_11495 [Chryseobacterium taiwanense]|uniref:Uncharacterized protein n=1 Tax=Chryseobacterium taiwanense TaxID=363331 RepID=A0A0B4D7Y9_9FLAO|nr:hypothetical protein RM51_11495 [Chryseobacterium taiwanense]